MVVTEWPSACAASTVHDFTGAPSSSTVHAPQEVVSQPMLVPVRPITSRRYCTSSVRASTSLTVGSPLTAISTVTSSDSLGIGGIYPPNGQRAEASWRVVVFYGYGRH